jgi:peptidoglycan/LPS O-acetylase OafA/YrhL
VSSTHWKGLDGLRAVAVVAAVGSHFGFLAKGAVSGVDLFFVISGYLITTLLLRERDDNGAVSLYGFWARRAFRLLPALGCAIAVALLVALFATSAQRHQTVVGLPWVLLYVGNWLRASGGNDVLGLLGHTWSLAVEEQFYIVWPILMAACIGRVLHRRRVALLLAGLALLDGLLYNPWAVSRWGNLAAFYRTDTRASAILAGCALALWMSQRDGPVEASAQAQRVLGALGTVSLVGFCALCTMSTYSNLLSTMASAGLVAGVVVVPQGRLSRLFATSGPRWVGLRSYGIYLYHGALATAFVESNRFHGVIHTEVTVGCAMATVVLAAASYRWVELPFLRYKRRFSTTTPPRSGDTMGQGTPRVAPA